MLEAERSVELLFEYASECNVGYPVKSGDHSRNERTEVHDLIDKEAPDMRFIILGLQGFDFGVDGFSIVDREVALEQVNYVGLSISPLRVGSWIYWNPVSCPIFERAVLDECRKDEG